MSGNLWSHSIYGLSGPDMEIRYVGKTKCGLPSRLDGHLQAAKNGTRPLHAWIRDVGVDLVMHELERFECESREYCRDAEMAERKWVAHYHDLGNEMFNVHYIPKSNRPRIITLEQRSDQGEQ